MQLLGLFRASFVTLILFVVACSSKVSSLKNDRDIALEQDSGYLFLTIDSDFNYSKFTISGPEYVLLKDPDFFEGKNYYLVPVEAGKYVINSFVDSFGGTYNISNGDDEDLWTFEVKPGGISYIGDFTARRVYGRYSKFELVNNASFALEYLEKKYPNILSKRTLTYLGPGDDFFFDLVTGQEK